MSAPIISWYESDNVTQFSAWNIGSYDTGSVTPDQTVLIWNNRGGGTAVSDAENCALTTKDSSGGNTGEPVEGLWIEVKCPVIDVNFNPVGGITTSAIKAKGSGVSSGIIKGTINGGLITDEDNFSEVLMHANIPPDGSPGTYNFRLRLGYSFI